jgi:signal transduction histidine kinase/CheY-like chemotaxis protein
LSEGGQTALRCDGSEFPAEIRQQQLKDLANRRLVIVRDISQLLALQRQLLQSQKMESLGRMAASVAHDFNTLLTVMTSACAQMHSSISPSNPARESLTLMEQATQRATSLARQLLTFGRRQPTKPRLMNLNETILGLVPILHRLLPENVRFSQDLADGLPAIRIDPSQLEQVLLNLISNARDAMPEGGGLTLKTYQASLPRISGSQEIGDQAGDYVILTVKDSGAGMDEATRSRVFEPFFTTKPEGKGTGLGLATVYGHVRLAGGRIEIDSTAGLGTEIRVALPAVASHEHACPLDAHGRGETVLVVEDDEPVRGLIKLILEAKGFHVLTTGDLNATTKLLQSHVGPIDLVITDMFLPGGVGTQVAEIARDIHPQLRVLVISGYGLEAVSRQDVVPPPSAYLAKPFAATTLVRCVRALLDQPL